jgi:CTP:molybdopterin cytidylyltransferase MocA
MIGSIICGIGALPRSDAYLIYPVDYPVIRKSTIEQMLAVLKEKACFNYIVPLYRGRKGHPVIISEDIASLISKGNNLPLSVILRDFLPTYCETDDPGVLRNVNTYEDLPPQ